MAVVDLGNGARIRTEEHLIIRRAGTVAGVTGPGGIYCVTCRMSPVNRHQLARAIGVSEYALGKFINRLPIRDDVAAKIRRAVARVEG